jgi:hypothetical protein
MNARARLARIVDFLSYGGNIAKEEMKLKYSLVFLIIVVGIISAILAYAFYVKLDIAVFLATAISALAYVFFTYWDTYVASPGLQITFDSAKPAEYTPQLMVPSSETKHALVNFRFIRAVIVNQGNRSAHGCVAKIQLLERPRGCTMFSEEPKTLKWVDIPQGNYIPPQGGNAVLGVAFSLERIFSIPGRRCAFQKDSDTKIIAYAMTPEALENMAMRAQDAFCTGDFKIRITVYCEEGDTVSKDFVLKVGDEWQKLNMAPVQQPF